MHKSAPSKGLSPMERKIPKSEKYAHVRSVLDTGLTVDKVKTVTAREFAKRRGEIFFRLTASQLYELYREYEQDEYESITDSATGVGGRIVTYNEEDEPTYNKPYLILDVREADVFRRSHLLQARSFPHAVLRRDQYHPDIYRFRNKSESLIIVYCDDERVSTAVAKDLVDRGIDNIYLLTGGINEFAVDFPSFIEGEIPPAAAAKVSTSTRHQPRLGKISEDCTDAGYSTHSRKSGRLGVPPSPDNKLTSNKLERHNETFNSSLPTGRRTSRSDAMSTTASNMSVAESVISRAAAKKGKF